MTLGLPCEMSVLQGWDMVVLAALGPAGQAGGVFHPRPSDPALHAALAPGAVAWEPLCCEVKSVWLKSRVFSGE